MVLPAVFAGVKTVGPEVRVDQKTGVNISETKASVPDEVVQVPGEITNSPQSFMDNELSSTLLQPKAKPLNPQKRIQRVERDFDMGRQGGDTCAGATVIGSMPYSDNGTTSGYTNDYDEVCPYSYSTAPDVVYVYTPSSDETIDVTLCTGVTDYDTKLYIYENTCASPYYACNDDACTSPYYPYSYVSELTGVSLTAGNDYYFIIDGYGSSSGDYTIDITAGTPWTPDMPCPGDSIFSQPPHNEDDPWTGVTSDTNLGYLVYDNFFDVSGQINDIHWWGFTLECCWSDCVKDPQQYILTFYQDAGGTPGTIVWGPTTISPIVVNTGYMYAGAYTVWYFSSAVTPGLTLSDGWVSIQGDGDPVCSFLWLSSPIGDGSSYQYDGTSLNPRDNDQAFCLTPEWTQIYGACCDDTTGVCTDNVEISDCPAPLRFVEDTLCADIVPACGLGACCDPDTGDCYPDTTESWCDSNYGPGNWIGGEVCDPNPCPQPMPECPDLSLFAQRVYWPDESWTFGTADEQPGYLRYESFDEGGNICDIHWWGINAYFTGFSWETCEKDPDMFNIIFYADDGGVPGDPVCTYLGVTPTKTYQGHMYSSFELIYYEFIMDPCCNMSDGWVSIQGLDAGQDCWFLWGASPVGDASSYMWDGTSYSFDTFDLSMCLTGEYVPSYGACCDDSTGVCTDNVEYLDCQEPLRFVEDTLCANIVPECGLGACCDPDTGDCYPDTTQMWCDSTYGTGNWYGGITCDPNPCPPPAPDNDDCENAEPVNAPYPQTVCGSTIGATVDCPGVLDWNAVWYAIEAPYAENHIFLDYCLTDIDIATVGIVVYDEPTNPPDACPDDCEAYIIADAYSFVDCPNDTTNPQIEWFTLPGPAVYYLPVYVVDYNDDPMDFCIEITVSPPPAPPVNDDCANAIAIGDVDHLAFDTTWATFDGSGTCMTGPNIWYCYTATCDGTVTANLCGSEYDTKLAVYDGCTCDPMGTEIDCNDDWCGLQSQVTFTATAGSEYLIEVGGWSTSAGEGELNIWCGHCVTDCPLGATPENEPCGTDVNGGCNSTPPIFSTIDCDDGDQTICGTLWAEYPNRDTDWYELVVTDPQGLLVNIDVEAELPYVAGFVHTDPPGTGDCADLIGTIDPLTSGNPCELTSVDDFLMSPGTYWIFIAPQYFEGYTCADGPWDYRLDITCTIPEVPALSGFGVVLLVGLMGTLVGLYRRRK
jgi:hypothetical protein